MGGASPPSFMREAVKILKDKYSNPCVPVMGAEIGVCFASNARDMFDNIPALYLHLVDNLSEMKDNSSGIDYLPDLGRDLKGILPGKYTWHKIDSADASRDFPDETFDFVYIDANHSYEYALQDCRLWWWKVKKGGVLCGHDYNLSFPNEQRQIGTHVQEAVNKFAEDMNVEVHHDQNKDDKNGGHSPIHDWWIFKNV